MHMEAELDEIHAERLLQWQQHLNKPLAEVVADMLARALDETPAPQETEGEKLLRILDEEGLIGCMHGDGNLAVGYKKHLWGNE
ncbi:MAG: hypothetical protein ACKN9T_16365 [Candidatus Methylumidiphilus sp.]